MNLLCPNCQKMLQVPEQYAGQLMKCPLCTGTFTVPSLPQAPAPAASPANPSPAAPPPPETYGLASPPPGPSPVPPLRREEPARKSTAAEPPRSQPAPVERPAPPAGYTRTYTISLSPRIVPWIAPAALGLVFVLLFLPWVGMYPAGQGVATQSAWRAAFGLLAVDENWERVSSFSKDQYDPGFSTLLIFYLLIFLFLAVPLAALSVALIFIPIQLPPVVQTFVPWRPAILGAVTLVAFVFLTLQLIWGFSLGNTLEELSEKHVEKDRQTLKKELVDLKRGHFLAQFNVCTTLWLRLAVILHLVAIAGAALEYWLQQRGSRPLPRAEIMW